MQLNPSIYNLAFELSALLKAKSLIIVTAESCTGGGLAKALTDIPGSSEFFDRGFVTYNNQAKHEVLNVSNEKLEHFGAVSEPVAREMAEGALIQGRANLAISVTGNAGPTSSEGKPVGCVWFAWAFKDKKTFAALKNFAGDRAAVREQAVEFALSELLKILSTH